MIAAWAHPWAVWLVVVFILFVLVSIAIALAVDDSPEFLGFLVIVALVFGLVWLVFWGIGVAK